MHKICLADAHQTHACLSDQFVLSTFEFLPKLVPSQLPTHFLECADQGYGLLQAELSIPWSLKPHQPSSAATRGSIWPMQSCLHLVQWRSSPCQEVRLLLDLL